MPLKLLTFKFIIGFIMGFATKYVIEVAVGVIQILWEEYIRDFLIKLMEYEVEIEIRTTKSSQSID